jgi:hypothetical protein
VASSEELASVFRVKMEPVKIHGVRTPRAVIVILTV